MTADDASTDRPRIRLEMALVDDAGSVLATASEPFELGQFDLAAARQGMRKLLAGLGGIGDDGVLVTLTPPEPG